MYDFKREINILKLDVFNCFYVHNCLYLRYREVYTTVAATVRATALPVQFCVLSCTYDPRGYRFRFLAKKLFEHRFQKLFRNHDHRLKEMKTNVGWDTLVHDRVSGWHHRRLPETVNLLIGSYVLLQPGHMVTILWLVCTEMGPRLVVDCVTVGCLPLHNLPPAGVPSRGKQVRRSSPHGPAAEHSHLWADWPSREGDGGISRLLERVQGSLIRRERAYFRQ